MDMGKVYAGLFKYAALSQHSGTAATAVGTQPIIFGKFNRAIDVFNGVANDVLQCQQIISNRPALNLRQSVYPVFAR